MNSDIKHDAVLQDGDKVYVGQRALVGCAGYNELEYGLSLEKRDLDDGGEEVWGCDLFFRNPDFAEHDPFGYLWIEESKLDCAQFSTPQAAVEYAEGTLFGMVQQLEDAGYLNLNGSCGDSLTIFEVDPALAG